MRRFLWLGGAIAALSLALPASASAQVSAPAEASPSPAPFSDRQLQSFARASAEFDELGRRLESKAPSLEQSMKGEAATNEILQRHDFDAATYNAIAQQMKLDPALAARVREMRAPAS